MRDLDHQLARTHTRHHILTQRFLLHLVRKLLCSLVVHIRFQQGLTDILHGLRNIDFGDSSLTFQYLKTPF